MKKLRLLLLVLFVCSCVPVYSEPAPTPTAVPENTPLPEGTPAPDVEYVAAYKKHFVYPVISTPIAVNLPPATPLEYDNFTADVQRWADKIRGWSVQYGVQERLVAILIQAASCGNPNTTSNDRYGLFGINALWVEGEANLYDPEIGASVALPRLRNMVDGSDPYYAYAAYFVAPYIFNDPTWMSHLPPEAERAQLLYLKSRTGEQVCNQQNPVQTY